MTAVEGNRKKIPGMHAYTHAMRVDCALYRLLRRFLQEYVRVERRVDFCLSFC